jgi:hypothetical protein
MQNEIAQVNEEEEIDNSLRNCCLQKTFTFQLKDGNQIKIEDFWACDTLPLSDAVGLLDGSSDLTGNDCFSFLFFFLFYVIFFFILFLCFFF